MQFLRSTIGQKILMAITGVGLIVWVTLHMLGNLQAFAGAETFNSYAEKLRAIPAALWAMRIVLAGGLSPDNVETAIRRVRPFAVDVSGGVERRKGIKDPLKVEAFMRGVERANQ